MPYGGAGRTPSRICAFLLYIWHLVRPSRAVSRGLVRRARVAWPGNRESSAEAACRGCAGAGLLEDEVGGSGLEPAGNRLLQLAGSGVSGRLADCAAGRGSAIAPRVGRDAGQRARAEWRLGGDE